MAEEVFGFNRADTQAIIEDIGKGDSVYRIGGSGGGGTSLFRFELTADFTSSTTVAATVKTMGGSTVGTGINIADPELIFFGLASGSKGLCILQDGTYYMIQALCEPEEGEP